MNEINIDLDLPGLLGYLEAHIRSLFGESEKTKDSERELLRQVRMETERASWVRVVGMEKAVSLKSIYQPSNIRLSEGPVPISTLLDSSDDAIIFAGPGRGKTTFLHWLFLHLLEGKEEVPLLFTLRLSGAVSALKALVAILAVGEIPKNLKGKRITLLVDGYDEINRWDRRAVSERLQEFSGLGLGKYILSSRTHYNIIELRGMSYYLEDFSKEDALRFVESFRRAYGGDFIAKELLSELESHGFSDFIGSPLMLALTCILKTRRMRKLPKNAVGFIRRALETLTFRWDEAKGIERDTRYPEVDGDDRVRCMMRIAYEMHSLEAPHINVQKSAQDHMRLLGQDRLDVDKLLEEIAQWYGLLIPVEASNWAFVHKTIHDFLAARFWVESGQFDPKQVTDWNIRAAYAACLIPDATETILYAMRHDDGVAAVAEILYNSPPLDRKKVAASIIGFFAEFHNAASLVTRPGFAHVEIKRDFFKELPFDLLLYMVQLLAGQSRRREVDIVVAGCFSELINRKRLLEAPNRASYLKSYGNGDFRFSVMRPGSTYDFQLGNVLENDV